MDHRLPLILALAAACTASPTPATTDPPLTSFYTEPDPVYRFELEIDGSTQDVFSAVLQVVHADGENCDPSWTIAAQVYDEYAPLEAVHFRLEFDQAPTVGAGGSLGDDSTEAGDLLEGWRDGADWEVHAPSWTLSALGTNDLRIDIGAGERCPTHESTGCEAFSSSSLRLVEAVIPFQPDEMWCRIDPSGDPGDLCFGGSGPDGTSRDELYEPCP